MQELRDYFPVAPARRRVRVDTRLARVALRRGVRGVEWVRSDGGTKTRYLTRPQAVRTKRLKEDAMFMPAPTARNGSWFSPKRRIREAPQPDGWRQRATA